MVEGLKKKKKRDGAIGFLTESETVKKKKIIKEKNRIKKKKQIKA